VFKCGHDFIDFSESVRTEHRYAHSDRVREFLENLAATSSHRHKVIPYDGVLWRAQRGCDSADRKSEYSDLTVFWAEDVPFDLERMKPMRNAAHEGRVNPKGIPCLYLSTDRDTAMAEVRPWMGAKISVGCFRTTKDLTVLDLTANHDAALTPDTLFKTSPPADVIQAVWTLVDKAFSKPITDDAFTAEYAPTQIIADMFSRHGMDGLYYRSRVGAGLNVALFDLDSANVISTHLFSTKTVVYEFDEEKSPSA
jgi:hypothetical protein